MLKGQKEQFVCFCFQAQRAEILRRLILRRSGLSEETLQILDLGAVAKETEGYAPQDLALLLERAVHANTVQSGHSDPGKALKSIHNKVLCSCS